MRRFLLLLTILVFGLSGFAQTTYTAHLFTGLTAPATTGQVCFHLKNYGTNVPFVAVTGVVADTDPPCVPAAANGTVTGTIYGSDVIAVTGCTPSALNPCTYWTLEYWVNGQMKATQDYSNIVGASVILDSLAPMTTIPVVPAPTGDSTYVQITGGNVNGSSGFLNFPQLKIAGSQYVTGLQGTTGVNVAVCAGSFTSGNLRSTDANGNCIDSGKAVPNGAVLGAPGVTVYASGSGTYTTPGGTKLLHIRMCGAGSGGSGGSSGGGLSSIPSATTFGSSYLTANGGAVGAGNTVAGAGGSASGGSVNITGTAGQSSGSGQSAGGVTGGGGPLGGAGVGGYLKILAENRGFFIAWDTTSVALVPNTEEYVLPAACTQLLRVREQLGPTDPWRIVTPAESLSDPDFGDSQFFSELGPNMDGPTSEFTYYTYLLMTDAMTTAENYRIRFEPPPYDNRAVELVYVSRFVEITGPNSVKVIPNEGDEVVLYDAIATLLGDNGDNPENAQQHSHAEELVFMKWVRKRQQQAAVTHVQAYIEDMD